MMGVSRIGAKGHQRLKGKSVRPQVRIYLKHLVRNLTLRDPFVNQLPEPCHGLIIDIGGSTHPFLLLLVLHAPCPVHGNGGIDKARSSSHLHERKQEPGL